MDCINHPACSRQVDSGLRRNDGRGDSGLRRVATILLGRHYRRGFTIYVL